ncbi:YhgE/Pip domain-containing protein [uncultured Limosilactobacillus sp.]|uniref:YhgE/Pip family protein n=1 Tax=uncultured Limosilactobacillus sp. TaxID=2837629 RepID=UPI0025CBCA60|nr:YhgE/Pip domain-containing protein [uncultured Limosilactobacillus sp.]
MKRLKAFLIRPSWAVAVMIIVAVAAPLMYSLSFIKSVWNPTAYTGRLPVAVVNNDRPVHYQGQTLNVGRQTVQQLKHNHQLDWQFVNNHQAKKGMANHQYYTVITIPDSFSHNAATVLQKHPRPMVLRYQTNDSQNYLAATISETGMTHLNTQVRAAVTKAYAAALFQNLSRLDRGMDTAASGAHQFSSGLVTMASGTKRYVVGVSQVNAGVQTLQTKVTSLPNATQQLSHGGWQLAGGLQQYAGGVGQLSRGLQELANHSGQLTGGTGRLVTGLTTLSGHSNSLRQGAHQLSAGTTQLNGATSRSLRQLNMQPMMSAMNQAQQLQGRLAYLKTGLDQAQAALGTTTASARQIQGTANQLTKAADQLGRLKTVAQNDAGIAAHDSQAARTAAQLAQRTTDPAVKAELAQVAATTGQSAQQAAENALTIQQLSPVMNNLGQLQGSLTSMQHQLNQLSSLQTVLSSAQTTISQADQLLTTLNGYQGQLGTMSENAQQLAQATKRISAGASALDGGLARYSQSVDQAAAGAHQLHQGLNGYVAGVQQANTGATQLAGASTPLTTGGLKLATGLNQLAQQAPQFTAGVGRLAYGTQQLTANSLPLLQGINLLSRGVNRLAVGLANGQHQLHQHQPHRQSAEMFASPTRLQHGHYSQVPNYGHAMAPFMMATGLFIGVLIFTLALPSSRILATNRRRCAMIIHELLLALTAALLMVIIQSAGLVMAGLQVQHPGQLLVVGMVYTLAQLAIMQALTIIMGRFGTVLGLVLFVAQLGGAGGMFPMELTNHFFNFIHPWLPMTYGINGFRQALTGGFNQAYLIQNVVMLLLFAGVAYALMLVVAAPLKRRVTNRQPVESLN